MQGDKVKITAQSIEEVMLRSALHFDQMPDPKDHEMAKAFRQIGVPFGQWFESIEERLSPTDTMLVLGELLTVILATGVLTKLGGAQRVPGNEGTRQLIAISAFQLFMETQEKLGIPFKSGGLTALINDYERQLRASESVGGSA